MSAPHIFLKEISEGHTSIEESASWNSSQVGTKDFERKVLWLRVRVECNLIVMVSSKRLSELDVKLSSEVSRIRFGSGCQNVVLDGVIIILTPFIDIHLSHFPKVVKLIIKSLTSLVLINLKDLS